MHEPAPPGASRATSSSAARCPSEHEVAQFVEGELGGPARADLERHLAECSACRRLVSALAGDSSVAPPVTPATSAAQLQPGAVVAGKYEILSTLGQGGMGIVFLAFHRTLRQRVALKFLLGEHARDPGVVSRFFREARAAAALGSDHVVRVLDADREPVTQEPFVALEYLEGRDLAVVLREDGPLAISAAVDVVLQACDALALAHRQQIVHRDIKPANLFLARQPDGTSRVKVLDFGIAKVAARAGANSTDRTAPSSMLGSPRYMAPEQLKDSASVDARADVWALGVTLFELLTGEGPFAGDSIIELFAAIATEPPRALRSLRPDAPEGLEVAVAGCLAKDRDQRTSTVGALASLLSPFAGPDGVAAASRAQRVLATIPSLHPTPSTPAPASAVTPPLPGEASTLRAHSSGTPPRGRSSLVLPALAGVAAVVGLTAVVGWMERWQRNSVAAPESTTHAVIPTPELQPSEEDDAPLASGELPTASAAPPSASAAPSASAQAVPPMTGPSTAVGASARVPIPRPPAAPPPASPPRSPPAKPTTTPATPPSDPLHRDGLTDRK